MPEAKQQTIEIVVVRPFFLKGETQKAGERISVPQAVGLVLIQTGKARRVKPEDSEAARSLPPESAQAPEAEAPESRGRRRLGARSSEEG